MLYQIRLGLRWHWVVDAAELDGRPEEVACLVALDGSEADEEPAGRRGGREEPAIGVHRLRAMVGSEVDISERLGNWHSIAAKLEGVKTLAVRKGPASLRLRMALDRLQNYIASAAE